MGLIVPPQASIRGGCTQTEIGLSFIGVGLYPEGGGGGYNRMNCFGL